MGGEEGGAKHSFISLINLISLISLMNLFFKKKKKEGPKFYKRNVKRNRTEIKAQKKSDFEHPTKRGRRGIGREEERKKKKKKKKNEKLKKKKKKKTGKKNGEKSKKKRTRGPKGVHHLPRDGPKH